MNRIRFGALLMFVAASFSALHAIPSVPELDPGNVVSVAMLIGGALLVLRGRRKK